MVSFTTFDIHPEPQQQQSLSQTSISYSQPTLLSTLLEETNEELRGEYWIQKEAHQFEKHVTVRHHQVSRQ